MRIFFRFFSPSSMVLIPKNEIYICSQLHNVRNIYLWPQGRGSEGGWARGESWAQYHFFFQRNNRETDPEWIRFQICFWNFNGTFSHALFSPFIRHRISTFRRHWMRTAHYPCGFFCKRKIFLLSGIFSTVTTRFLVRVGPVVFPLCKPSREGWTLFQTAFVVLQQNFILKFLDSFFFTKSKP